MKISANTTYQTEGADVDSVEIKLSDDTLSNIKKAKGILNENPFLSSVTVNPSYDDNILLNSYDLETPEEEQEESDFRLGSHKIVITKHSVYYRAFCKYDSSNYFEVELSI